MVSYHNYSKGKSSFKSKRKKKEKVIKSHKNERVVFRVVTVRGPKEIYVPVRLVFREKVDFIRYPITNRKARLL